MPMFTMKMTEGEARRLEELAGKRSKAQLIRDWMSQPPQKAHTACDATIAALQAELARYTVSTHPVDMVDTSTAAEGNVDPDAAENTGSTLGTLYGVGVPVPHNPDDQMALPGTPKTFRLNKPEFLAAKDEACLNCGHEKHEYHLGATCTFPVAPRQRCGCASYIDPVEPF